MNQTYIAIAGGALLILLGLASVWRPAAFWGVSLEAGEGKNAERRKEMVRRRLQLGTAGFIIAGATFAGIGIWQVLNGG
jgi:hypothetical protein